MLHDDRTHNKRRVGRKRQQVCGQGGSLPFYRVAHGNCKRVISATGRVTLDPSDIYRAPGHQQVVSARDCAAATVFPHVVRQPRFCRGNRRGRPYPQLVSRKPLFTYNALLSPREPSVMKPIASWPARSVSCE